MDRIVEDFVLLNETPLEIVTGNSIDMKKIVKAVLKRHDLGYHYQNYVNLGSLIVTEKKHI